MKHLLFAFCIACLAACQGGADNSQANSELVQDYVTAVASMDVNAMEQYLSEDYMGYGPSIDHQTNKEQAVAGWKENVANLYEKIEYNKSKVLAVTVPEGENAGEWVSHWANLSITYQSGESVTILANSIYKVEGDKIVQSYTFYNEADALRQLGYVFINPNNI